MSKSYEFNPHFDEFRADILVQAANNNSRKQGLFKVPKEPLKELEKQQNLRFKKYRQEAGSLEMDPKTKELFYHAKTGQAELFIRKNFSYSRQEINLLTQVSMPEFILQERKCALYFAARRGDYLMCQFLLKSGADPNLACKNGVTPTHIAFSTNNMDVRLSESQLPFS